MYVTVCIYVLYIFISCAWQLHASIWWCDVTREYVEAVFLWFIVSEAGPLRYDACVHTYICIAQASLYKIIPSNNNTENMYVVYQGGVFCLYAPKICIHLATICFMIIVFFADHKIYMFLSYKLYIEHLISIYVCK